ncbi:hypothetical protein SD70_00130 [Gordoniibacillus kamchatkensis]|uniref:NodB homology domain-containing protein n=1 Tax=Gordoniibacillus kamchatkensis TaxID=1590651 RepID=A0ABR5AMY6_9BACL|nr:polysaccharide deacetylase family protein [Paenibacillus sp. VKM B-2647]KIL42386.1 hypothetical protein SD70_00130 [Paenibacillus sp. VKM B-2647]
MRNLTTVALVCALLSAASAGCSLKPDSSSAPGGAAALTLPPAAQLESALQAPQPTPAPPGPASEPARIPPPGPANAPDRAPSSKPAEIGGGKAEPAPVPPPVPSPAAPAAADRSRQAPPASADRKPAAKPKKERGDKKSIPVQQQRVAQKALSLGQLRQKYSSSFKVSGSPAENKIALTFDDGPDDKFTVQVLDTLKQYNVKATFFVIGFRAKQHPELIARMVREGHVVGNHSYNHANLPKLSDPSFEQQVEHTQAVLKSLIGYEPKLFRPPYGAVNENQVKWAAEHQFLIVNWNVDSLDWKGLSEEQVTRNILSSTRAGSIVLQHCGGGGTQDLSGTVKALPTVIKQLKSKGYQFVTVPELLHVPKNK